MSSLTANSQGNLKKVMRTALVGIRPADQIMIKGYLRVLLRLEADLEWVSANHPDVDLFIIHDEFRNAANVKRLLLTQQQKPVLYAKHSQTNEGNVTGDTLTLPLRQLHILNDWLIKHVPALSSNAKRRVSVPEKEMDIGQTNTVNHQQAQPQRQQVQPQHRQQTPPTESHRTATTNDYQGLIQLIKQLQQRPDGLFELVSDKPIAIIQPSRQRLWQIEQTSHIKLSLNWHLRTYRGAMPSLENSKDMNQWLWEQAFSNPKDLLPLISDDEMYRLKHWIKPSANSERKELLRLMTALEYHPRNVLQLSNLTETSIKTVKKGIAGLLLSGNLQPEAYKNLRVAMSRSSEQPVMTSPEVKTTETPRVFTVDTILEKRATGEPIPRPQVNVHSNSSTNNGYRQPQTEQVKPPVHSEEKRGFLSRLRQKLGL